MRSDVHIYVNMRVPRVISRGIPTHDRLMQTYIHIMLLDINIFPLIRQMPSPPPRAASQWENYYSRVCGAAWKSSTLSRPSLDSHCTVEKMTERSSRSRSTNREDRAVSRTHRILSRRWIQIGLCGAGQSFRSRSYKDAFTERYANTSSIFHAILGATQTSIILDMNAPPAHFLRRSNDSWNSAPRRKPMRIRNPTFITGWLRMRSAIGNCKFCRGIRT